jgi:antirestriction protein ArdC
MYIKGWLQVLKDEPQALVKACALAEKAYQFITGLESRKEQIAA